MADAAARELRGGRTRLWRVADAEAPVDAAELRGVLGKLGHDLGKKYVANVLKKYDDDGSKALSLKEFKAVIASILGAADDGEGEEEGQQKDQIDHSEPVSPRGVPVPAARSRA